MSTEKKKSYHCCGNITLFQYKYVIENDQSPSYVTIEWRRYEHLNYNTRYGDALSKIIGLRGDKICVIYFMKTFELYFL